MTDEESTTAYQCPRCGGGFPEWDRRTEEGTLDILGVTATYHCPWCGLAKGEIEQWIENQEQAAKETLR